MPADTSTIVGMHLNTWAQDYGKRGREADRLLRQKGADAGFIRRPVEVDFAE